VRKKGEEGKQGGVLLLRLLSRRAPPRRREKRKQGGGKRWVTLMAVSGREKKEKKNREGRGRGGETNRPCRYLHCLDLFHLVLAAEVGEERRKTEATKGGGEDRGGHLAVLQCKHESIVGSQIRKKKIRKERERRLVFAISHICAHRHIHLGKSGKEKFRRKKKKKEEERGTPLLPSRSWTARKGKRGEEEGEKRKGS